MSRFSLVVFAVLSLFVCVIGIVVFSPPRVLSSENVGSLLTKLRPVVGAGSYPYMHANDTVVIGNTVSLVRSAVTFGMGTILAITGMYILARYVQKHPKTNWSVLIIALGFLSLLSMFFASEATTASFADPKVVIENRQRDLDVSVYVWQTSQQQVVISRKQCPRLLMVRALYRGRGYGEIALVWNVDGGVAGVKLIIMRDVIGARAFAKKLASALEMQITEVEE